VNIAWIAGFFDGEGCVYIFPHCKGMQVSITQKDRTPLDLIRAFYGFGKVNKKGGGCHVWVVCGRNETMKFLRSIRQYCIVKRKDVEIAILYAKTFDSSRHGCFSLDDKTLKERQKLRKELRGGKRYKKAY
jgi:hypothetical protein